jgi:hypothetical protein
MPESLRLRFFLFERAQRVVERRHDLAERVLEFVEFVNLAGGVAQKVAQRLILLAEAQPGVGEAFGGAGFVGARSVDVVAFRPNKFDNFAMTRLPNP